IQLQFKKFGVEFNSEFNLKTKVTHSIVFDIFPGCNLVSSSDSSAFTVRPVLPNDILNNRTIFNNVDVLVLLLAASSAETSTGDRSRFEVSQIQRYAVFCVVFPTMWICNWVSALISDSTRSSPRLSARQIPCCSEAFAMVSRSWKYPALWLLASFASHASRKLNRVFVESHDGETFLKARRWGLSALKMRTAVIREASTRLHRPQRRRSQGAADMSGDRALAGWVLDE
ncbi:unnamed protein product, partial [Symbiodinium microadriaticum]